jgi:hypothetical protein
LSTSRWLLNLAAVCRCRRFHHRLMRFPSVPVATVASDKIGAQLTAVHPGRIYRMLPVVGGMGTPDSGKQDLLSSCAHPGDIAQARILQGGRRQNMMWAM